MTVSVTLGDCMKVLAEREGTLFDSVVTDPPYHLLSTVKRFANSPRTESTMPKSDPHARMSRGFMGQKWDGGDVAFQPEMWRIVFDQMKPGAHLVAFSGTRTYHRMACAIEDAGFEIRDQLAWMYGSGFPKAHDAGDGWKTAIKPAWEPICLARKPIEGTVIQNRAKYGTGALNIDGCRIGDTGARNNGRTVDSDIYGKLGPIEAVDYGMGRFPANVLHDGSDEVLAGFPESAGQLYAVGPQHGIRDSVNVYGDYGARPDTPPRGDSGSASRFFYSAKAGPLDRIGSPHPTIKPVDVMRWLTRLVTPKGGLILDMFAGSGTTGIAAMVEGFDCELIDLMPAHVADIERKLAYLRGEGKITIQEHTNGREKERDAKAKSLPMLDWLDK